MYITYSLEQFADLPPLFEERDAVLLALLGD
jgi:hypothetical protein